MSSDPLGNLFINHPIPYGVVITACAAFGGFGLVRFQNGGPVGVALVVGAVTAAVAALLMRLAWQRRTGQV